MVRESSNKVGSTEQYLRFSVQAKAAVRRELEQLDRGGRPPVHRGFVRSAPGGRARDRRVTALDEAPRPVDPRRAGVVDTDAGRGDHRGRWFIGGGRLEPEWRARVAQVDAGPAGVEAEGGGDQPGPLASRSRGKRSIRSAAASARSPVTLRRRAVDRTMRSTRIASMPSSGSTARTRKRRARRQVRSPR